MISIIIPTLNDRLNLSNLFSDISKQTLSPFEVICVDGGSTDGTIELVKSYCGKCIIETQKPNNGILCTNLGAEHAKGDILLFTASDVRLKSDTLSIIRNEFKSDSGLIAMTGMPIPYDGNIICRFEYAMYYLIASLVSRFRFVTSGSFLVVKRSAFIKANGFPFTYNSDGELGMKLHYMGKTKFKNYLKYQVSARRFNLYGFLRFNREYLYTLENFVPLNMTKLGELHVKSPSH